MNEYNTNCKNYNCNKTTSKESRFAITIQNFKNTQLKSKLVYFVISAKSRSRAAVFSKAQLLQETKRCSDK